jgi:hypothetical protein
MTDPAEPETSERIRRLQERRAAATAPARPRAASPRRAHPATASRILAGGLSLASFFTVMAAFGIRQNGASSAVAPAPSATTVLTPAPTVAIPATAAPTSATPVPPTTPAPVNATPAPQPVPPQTTTRGS